MKKHWMSDSWANKINTIPIRALESALVISSIIVLIGCDKNLPSESLANTDYHQHIVTRATPVPFKFTDTRDGKTYQAARIGTQTWMVENLAYLPSVSPSMAGSLTENHYYTYDYEGSSVDMAKSQDNYKKYGALYNWKAAMTSCPSGWHLPSDTEWAILIDYLTKNGFGYSGYEGDNEIGKSIASATGWMSSSDPGSVGNTQSINNSSGFNAVPGGLRGEGGDNGGGYVGMGYSAYFWSSTAEGLSNAWGRGLDWTNPVISVMSSNRSYGNSVRCLKD